MIVNKTLFKRLEAIGKKAFVTFSYAERARDKHNVFNLKDLYILNPDRYKLIAWLRELSKAGLVRKTSKTVYGAPLKGDHYMIDPNAITPQVANTNTFTYWASLRIK